MTLALERPVTTTIAEPTNVDAANVDELVRRHLPLVGHLVRELRNRVPAQVHQDDLISAAMYALAASAKNYDPSKGVPFAAYASLRIRGALTDELRSMDWASRGVRGKAREVDTVRATLTQTLGRTPSSAEVAHTMGISIRELSMIASDVHRASVTSLQAVMIDNSDEVLPTNQDGPEALLLQREQLGYLRDAIAELPPRLRQVVEQYFFQQRRMTDIALELGVTESRVSQLRSEALVMLREVMHLADGRDPSASSATAPRRQAGLRAYASAAAARSTLSSRLGATSLLAEYCG